MPTSAPSTPWYLRLLELDVRSLALLRLTLGGLLLIDIVQRWSQWAVHYSEFGVLPRATLLKSVWNPAWFSLATVVSRPTEIHFVFGLLTLVAACLMLGWHTRWATFLAWVGLVSLHNRNPLVLDLGDAYFRMVLFWALFLPWGRLWSLDARAGRPDRSLLTAQAGADGLTLRSLLGLALLLQVALMAQSIATASVALGQPPQQLPWTPVFQEPPGKSLAEAVGMWEIGGLLLLCVPFDRGQVRGAAALIYVGLHLLVALLCDSGLLFPLAACLPLALLSAWWWEVPFRRAEQALNRWFGQPAHQLTVPTGPDRPRLIPGPALHAFLLLFVFGWAGLRSSGSAWEAKLPGMLTALGQCLRVEPPRERFPLVARSAQGQFLMKASRRDGTKFSAGPDKEPAFHLKDHRWRNYLASVWTDKNEYVLFGFGHYLCLAWSPKAERSLFDVDRLQVVLALSRDGGSDVLLFQHSCFATRNPSGTRFLPPEPVPLRFTSPATPPIK